MARTTAEALDRLQDLLAHPDTGVNMRMAAIESRDGVIMARIPAAQILEMDLPADIADENLDFDYPLILLFAEQAENENVERFAWFSGSIAISVEIRLTADKPDTLEPSIHRYAEAVLDVLQDSAGEWSAGLMYNGRYSVRYLPSTLGGDNFLQSARISLTLEQYVNA